MGKILCIIVMYSSWTLLNLINFNLIYDKFLLVERKTIQNKKVVYFWVIIMFPLSMIYGLVISGNFPYGKVVWFCLFFPFYFKLLPYLRSAFERKKNDIVIILFYQLLVDTITQAIYLFVQRIDVKLPYTDFVYDLCALATIIGITLFLLVLLYFRKNNILKIYFGELNIRQYALFCSALFIADLIEIGIMKQYAEDTLFKVLTLLNVIAVCFLIGQIILVRESDSRKGKIIDVLDEQMEKVTGYYKEVIEQETQIRKFRHDSRNLLLALHSLVESGETAEALQYIEKMSDICKQSVKRFDTGNFVADTLLNAKAANAEGIDTELSFQGFIPSDMENVDLVILLSNILDNALEACEKVTGKRIIYINSILQKQMWVLTVKNPTVNKVKIQRNRITTTKENKEIHGFGLQNMERVVQKYQGNLKLECDDDIFTVTAILQLGKK